MQITSAGEDLRIAAAHRVIRSTSHWGLLKHGSSKHDTIEIYGRGYSRVPIVELTELEGRILANATTVEFPVSEGPWELIGAVGGFDGPAGPCLWMVELPVPVQVMFAGTTVRFEPLNIEIPNG